MLGDVEHPENQCLVHDLFLPLLVSTAGGDTGHHEVANMEKQRCIPFDLSLAIVSLADLKGKGFFNFFLFFIFLGTSQLLLKNQYMQLFTYFELNLMSFAVVGLLVGSC